MLMGEYEQPFTPMHEIRMIPLHSTLRARSGPALWLAVCAMLLMLPGHPRAESPALAPVAAIVPLLRPFAGTGTLGQLPPDWTPFSLQQDKPATSYALARVEGRMVLEAVADKSSSIVIWEREFNPRELNILAWAWRVERSIPVDALDPEQTEDAAARVMVLFTYDPDRESLVDRMTYNALKMIYGVYPPARSMNYVWGRHSAPPDWQESRRTERVRSLVLPRGETGQWFQEQRDLTADFRAAFGDAELPTRARIAIMADADASQAQVRSLFDAFVLGTSTIAATALRDTAPTGRGPQAN